MRSSVVIFLIRLEEVFISSKWGLREKSCLEELNCSSDHQHQQQQQQRFNSGDQFLAGSVAIIRSSNDCIYTPPTLSSS